MNLPESLTTGDGRLTPRRLLVALVVLAVVAAGSWFAWHRMTALPDNAAFSYDGEVETTSELDARIHTLGALYGVQRPTDPKKEADFRRAAAQADALSLILDKAAASEGIVIADKKARDTLQQMIKTQLGSEQAYDALLTQYGVGEDDILLEVKRQQAIALLFQKVTKSATATPSDADVEAYFARHTKNFSVPEKRHIANLVVSSKGAATKLLSQARTTDFAALARAHSLDDATRTKGGDLGTVTAADLDDAYAAAAFGASEGGLFGPVQTMHGWNVGKVIDVVPGRAVSLAKVKPTVIATMRSERALAAWRSWLTKKVQDADVRYADAYEPEDPDAIPDLKGLPGSDDSEGLAK